jgi:hypothetical protein
MFKIDGLGLAVSKKRDPYGKKEIRSLLQATIQTVNVEAILNKLDGKAFAVFPAYYPPPSDILMAGGIGDSDGNHGITAYFANIPGGNKGSPNTDILQRSVEGFVAVREDNVGIVCFTLMISFMV